MKNDQCTLCGTKMMSSLLLTQTGPVSLCPNCSCVEALVPKLKLEEGTDKCFFCGKPNCGTAYDFKFDEERTHISYHVCQPHFVALQKLNLAKKDFRKLKKAFGITFNIHEDFYDEKGNPMQPRD